jgi:TusA-related sulfurtransferase
MTRENIVADQRIDISEETCPMTFVLVRLALDQMKPGEILEITLRGAEPRRNIPITAQEQGHEVLSISDQSNEDAILLLQKSREILGNL